jgi:hypothetical protein
MPTGGNPVVWNSGSAAIRHCASRPEDAVDRPQPESETYRLPRLSSAMEFGRQSRWRQPSRVGVRVDAQEGARGRVPSAVSATNNVWGSSNNMPTSGATPAGPAGIEMVRTEVTGRAETQMVPVTDRRCPRRCTRALEIDGQSFRIGARRAAEVRTEFEKVPTPPLAIAAVRAAQRTRELRCEIGTPC